MGRHGSRPPDLLGPCRRWRPVTWLKAALPLFVLVVAEAGEAEDEDVERPYNPELPPLVIIPPFTGSVLQVAVNESSVANPLCGLALSDQLWPPVKAHLALLDCWSEQMKVSIDPAATRAAGKEVSQRLPGVRVSTVPSGSAGAEPLVKGIFEPVLWQMQRLGYRRGKNLFTAPFDWRRGPGHWAEHSWPRLKSSVERLVREHGGKPAIFLSMSMGSPYFVAFLLHHPGVDAAWKQRHVAGFVSLSGPFAGTASALSFLLWGRLWPGADDEHTEGARTYHRLLNSEATAVLKPLMDGWGSIAWLLPVPALPASPGVPVVELPPAWGGNVTVEMLPEILARFSPSAAELYALGRRFPTHEHPGVKVHCFFGTGSKAPGGFAYLGAGTAEPPTGSRAHAELAARMATEALRKRGVTIGDRQTQDQLVGLAGELADLVAPGTTTAAPLRDAAAERAAAGPPPGAARGSREWLAAAEELLGGRVPEETVPVEGDGLVERSSLAVCERWRGRPGLPDSEVHHMRGVRHALESHNEEQLFYVRRAVARLAGLPDVANRVGCSVRKARCPHVRRKALCFQLSLARRLRPEHECCQEAAASHRCMGMSCTARMLGSFVAANPKADYVIEGWRMGCTNVEYPTRARIQKSAANARRKIKDLVRTTARKGDCLARLPGVGCPDLPHEQMRQCNYLAAEGLLRPEDACCGLVGEALDCMGEHCFAEFVAAHSLEGVAVAGSLVPLVRAWRRGCANPRIPVEAVQSLMNRTQSIVNRTQTVMERLAPLGAAAAAAQLLEGLLGGSSHGGRSGPKPGASEDAQQGKSQPEASGSNASSVRQRAQTEEPARAARGNGAGGAASAAVAAAGVASAPSLAGVVAACSAGMAVAAMAGALAWAVRRRRRRGDARGPGLLRDVPLEEGGLPAAAAGAAQEEPQAGEEAYRPLSTPRV